MYKLVLCNYLNLLNYILQNGYRTSVGKDVFVFTMNNAFYKADKPALFTFIKKLPEVAYVYTLHNTQQIT